MNEYDCYYILSNQLFWDSGISTVMFYYIFISTIEASLDTLFPVNVETVIKIRFLKQCAQL